MNPFSVTFFAIAIFSLPGGLASQASHVSPPGARNSFGQTGHSLPFDPMGFQSHEFVQQIHEDLSGQQLLVKGLAFRPVSGNLSYASRTYDLELSVGDAASGAAFINQLFTQNWKSGGARATVFNGKVSLPASPLLPVRPADFPQRIPFASSYQHAGSSPLLWQLWVRGANQTSSSGLSLEAGPSTRIFGADVGTGCAVRGQAAPLRSVGVVDTSRWEESLNYANPNAAPFLAFGNQDGTYAGLPLPISLAPLGSAGCYLSVNPLLYLAPTSKLSANSYRVTVQYTPIPPLFGLAFRTQWASDDQGKLRTSQGLDYYVPYPFGWPLAQVGTNGFTGPPPPVGARGKPLVTLFY